MKLDVVKIVLTDEFSCRIFQLKYLHKLLWETIATSCSFPLENTSKNLINFNFINSEIKIFPKYTHISSIFKLRTSTLRLENICLSLGFICYTKWEINLISIKTHFINNTVGLGMCIVYTFLMSLSGNSMSIMPLCPIESYLEEGSVSNLPSYLVRPDQ